jgi:hypothetical protein
MNWLRRLVLRIGARFQGKHLCEHYELCHRLGDRYELGDPEGGVFEYFYCWEHAHAAGFCYRCGEFWGGIESFDFNQSHLCDNCEFEVRADDGEFDEEEACWF